MLNESKKHELRDLIVKIDEVDKMIKIHSSNPSKFMLEQYEAKKEKLLSYLIEELISVKVRSVYSFRIIDLALTKFYPELRKVQATKFDSSDDPHYKDLKGLESVLVKS